MVTQTVISNMEEYVSWVQDVCKKYRSLQIKAAISVNYDMLSLYWNIGSGIVKLQGKYNWGSGFYDTLSRDMREALPDVKSFSATNLRYMKRFYELFCGNREILPQVGEEFMAIPWGHIKLIIDRCSGEPEKANFYVHEVLQNNWSRAVLLNFLDSDLFSRQGRAVTNFKANLDSVKGDLAQAITKDPYCFDFITLTENYNEKELKDALMDNITKFLLELGNGFAFVGREVRLVIGNTENFVDMLFYNIKLHCYVVIEVKVEEFDARDMGQLGTYMVAVNHQLKGENDEPTLGLLICKSKDNVKARYALEASSQPMGISQYDVNSFMPEKFKSSLPSIAEIENTL